MTKLKINKDEKYLPYKKTDFRKFWINGNRDRYPYLEKFEVIR